MSSTSSAGLRPAPLPLAELRRINLRRLLLVIPSLGFAAALWGTAIAVLAATPHGVLDWLLLVPFGIAMSWECLIVWQLVIGYVQGLRGEAGASPIERLAASVAPVPTGRSRTALLVPIFEEDVGSVFAGIEVMLRSLGRLGSCADVEVHVLSDTREDAVATAEEAAATALAGRMAGVSLVYRRRIANTGRKAGNIAHFLEAHGSRFDFAIVLDADSLMSGEAVRRLIRVMEECPRIGLVQTVSYAAGRGTLFARIQQFAVRLYAPLALRGLQFWQGPEGSYWGHNAIFRVAPFMAHCRLPVLPGRAPLGGEILCHDVVEGALLTRAGWEVHLLPDLEGTWEEMPTNVLDLMGRERRWCQGNLQHLRVLAWPGLTAASRAHLALGIAGYLVAPIWWIFVLGGALRVLAGPDDGHYGLLAFGLTEDGPAAAALLAGCATLLMLPRVLNMLRAFCDPQVRSGFGGAGALMLGAALEQVFWLFLGPALALFAAIFVTRTLLGHGIAWDRQVRFERHVAWGEAARRHTIHILVGLGLGMAAVAGGGWYMAWMAPTVLGLCLSPCFTVVSSRRDLGRLSRRLGLFVTSDDVHEAPEMRELQRIRPA